MTWSRAAHVAWLGILVALAVSCQPRSDVDRAVRARGRLGAVVIEAEARVHKGFPGQWRWRRTFSGGRYAWTVFTTGEPLHHLFDGAVVRAFVGSAPTAEDASPEAPLRSQARFVAVMLLDALTAAGVLVEAVAPESLPTGMRAGATVAFPGEPERYTVLFDDELRPVRVEGPIDLSPVGRGRLSARQAEFRPVAGRLLPHHVAYELDGVALADERVLALCVHDGPLPAEAFAHPSRLPDCGADPH